MMRALLLATALVLSAAPARAERLRVDAAGTGPYPTIAAALAAAADGDIIELEPGIYRGEGNRNLDLEGKAVTLTGNPARPDSCILDLTDADTPARAFVCTSGETAKTMIVGVTVLGGAAPGRDGGEGMGGAVLCVASSPWISHCNFRENRAHTGGAIALENASPQIDRCVFVQNTAEVGGAVSVSGGDPDFKNCTFQGNTAARGGAVAGFGATGSIVGSVFNANSATQGGAVALDRKCDVRLSACLLSNNFASFGGGIFLRESELNCDRGSLVHGSAGSGGGLHLAGGAHAVLRQSLVALSIRGGAVAMLPGATIEAFCCLIHGNQGGDWTGPLAPLAGADGNLDADPLRKDAARGDYAPGPDSPLLSAPCGPIGAVK